MNNRHFTFWVCVIASLAALCLCSPTVRKRQSSRSLSISKTSAGKPKLRRRSTWSGSSSHGRLNGGKSQATASNRHRWSSIGAISMDTYDSVHYCSESNLKTPAGPMQCDTQLAYEIESLRIAVDKNSFTYIPHTHVDREPRFGKTFDNLRYRIKILRNVLPPLFKQFEEYLTTIRLSKRTQTFYPGSHYWTDDLIYIRQVYEDLEAISNNYIPETLSELTKPYTEELQDILQSTPTSQNGSVAEFCMSTLPASAKMYFPVIGDISVKSGFRATEEALAVFNSWFRSETFGNSINGYRKMVNLHASFYMSCFVDAPDTLVRYYTLDYRSRLDDTDIKTLTGVQLPSTGLFDENASTGLFDEGDYPENFVCAMISYRTNYTPQRRRTCLVQCPKADKNIAWKKSIKKYFTEFSVNIPAEVIPSHYISPFRPLIPSVNAGFESELLLAGFFYWFDASSARSLTYFIRSEMPNFVRDVFVMSCWCNDPSLCNLGEPKSFRITVDSDEGIILKWESIVDFEKIFLSYHRAGKSEPSAFYNGRYWAFQALISVTTNIECVVFGPEAIEM